MATFKNPNGLWYARVSTGIKGPNGNYKYVTSKHGKKTRDEALMDEAQLRIYVAGNKAAGLTRMRNHELIDRYLGTRSVRPSTLKSYQAQAKKIKQYLPDVPATDTTPLMIETFRRQLQQENMRVGSYRNVLLLLKMAFQWAADMDIIMKNPARNLQLPKGRESQGLHIEIDLVQQILQIAKTKQYAELYMPLLLAGMCGLRISEICGLQPEDVTSNAISVRQNLDYVNKQFVILPLKTKASARVVPVIAPVSRAISEYREFIAACHKAAQARRIALKKSAGFMEAESDPAWFGKFFYVHPDDGRPYTREYVERTWRDFKLSPEMQPLISRHPELARMRIHDFRHSFGSNLRCAGVPIEDVTEIMGHTDSNFTRATYALPLPGTHERSMKKLEAMVKNL